MTAILRRPTLALASILVAACTRTPVPERAPSAATAARAVPFTVRSVPGQGPVEFVQGVALLGTNAIDVLVTAARLADDTPRTRLLRLRAGVFTGDPTGQWRSVQLGDAVAIDRVRALGPTAGRDTVRLRIARAARLDLQTQWLGFELGGEVAPPGMSWSPATRPLHGERGALAAR